MDVHHRARPHQTGPRLPRPNQRVIILCRATSPFAAALIGYTVSSLVVAGAALLREKERSSDRPGRGFLWFSSVGLCNGCAVLALYVALQHGPVTLVSPLVATYPLFTLVLTTIFFRGTRLELRRVAGVVTTVAGVAVLLSA